MQPPIDSSHPWSPDEFREVFPEVPAMVRAPFRQVCNLALRDSGLTREEIIDAYRDRPEALGAASALAALMDRGEA